MKKAFILIVLIFYCTAFFSCSTAIRIGSGKYAFLLPDKGGAIKETRTKTNWYILFGLIPLGDNSTESLIGPKEKVFVQTYTSFINILTDIFTSIVTIESNTVEVNVIR